MNSTNIYETLINAPIMYKHLAGPQIHFSLKLGLHHSRTVFIENI